jgi:bifunctional UDP-N-acetylglucosamine pyrophosphorylase/glucosamine-1-phosphate N-acetyltransferase
MDSSSFDKDRFSRVAGIVLAAGKGTRMQSETPKVLQTLLDVPMLWYVLSELGRVCQTVYPVVGYMHERVEATFPQYKDFFVRQKEQKGTGHAVDCALPEVQKGDFSHILVLNGDTPLITAEVLTEFVDKGLSSGAPVSVLSMEPERPDSYGRIVRLDNGGVDRIVEARDIDDPQIRGIKEVNSGIYLLRLDVAETLLSSLDADNRQNEYYLTQVVELARKSNYSVQAFNSGNLPALLGINTVSELCLQEDFLRSRIVHEFLGKGVVVRNPANVSIGPFVDIEPGAEICGPARISGKTCIKKGSLIEANTVIEDCSVRGAAIRSFSHLSGAIVEENCQVGPFARLRPGTFMSSSARVGNFVEIKKSVIGRGSKVNHLSYVGDSELGQEVNIGAGTITCNYDGQNKHKTEIGDKAFVGSNTALVAPVSVGAGSLVGAGSTITRDVPADSLAVARVKQKNLERKK